MGIDRETLKIRMIEIVILVCITYIFIFYVLKTMGIINTPMWLQLSPLIAAFLSAFAAVKGLTKFFIRLNGLPESHERLTVRVDKIGFGLTRVENDLTLVKKDVEFVKKDVEFVKKDVDVIKSDVRHLMKCRNYRPAY